MDTTQGGLLSWISRKPLGVSSLSFSDDDMNRRGTSDVLRRTLLFFVICCLFLVSGFMSFEPIGIEEGQACLSASI